MPYQREGLEDATFRLLERSWTRVNRKSRTYRVYLDDPKIIVKMLRPQEIPMLVAEGLYDVGITGRDWVAETGSDVEPILDLEYGKIRLVVAFPDKYRYKGLDEMIADYAKKKKTLRISSEYLTTASAYIKKIKVILEIFWIPGSANGNAVGAAWNQQKGPDTPLIWRHRGQAT